MEDKFLFVESKDSSEWISFWKNALKSNIDFLRSQGLGEYKNLQKFHARALVEPPLWRIPAINGKYHTRYYSRDVWEKTVKEGKLPNKHAGTWTSSRAEVVLEHVVERAPLIAFLMENPSQIDIIERICVCCVVTKGESRMLPSKRGVDPDNVWKRYLEGKVDVFDRQTGSWHILAGNFVE